MIKNSFSYLDPDFGWHLKVGQEIGQTGQVPTKNYYNYTYTGNWVDHEWLSNYLTAFVYDHFGYIVLTFVFAGIALVALIIIYRRAQALVSCSKFTIAFFLLAGTIASLPHMGIRVQELGLLFLAILLLMLDSYSREKKVRYLWFTLPLLYLWSCLHASFLIGIFLIGAYLAVKVAERSLSNRFGNLIDESQVFSWGEIRNSGLIFFLAGLSTFCTPYGLKLYSFLAGYQSSYYQGRIQEWLSQFSYPFQYLQLFYLVLVGLGLFCLFFYGKQNSRIKLWPVFLTVLFFFLSFKSRRHFPLLFVASFPFLIETYALAFFSERRTNKIIPLWLQVYLVSCLLLVIISVVVRIDYVSEPFESYCQAYPCRAANYLEKHPELDSKNIFNEYTWGGYLIYRLPQRRLFIDGRLPQVAYAGHSFLEEYDDFFKTGRAALDLEKYQIGIVLIRKEDEKIKVRSWEKLLFLISDEQFNRTNGLRAYLETSSQWSVAYSDDTSVIYVKNR